MFFEFNANTRIVQEITEVALGYTFQQIIEGLQEGTFATSLSNGELLDLETMEVAAKVVTVESTGEYNDFQPVIEDETLTNEALARGSFN